MKKISNAIILAAGGSSRYGENKLQKNLCGKTLPQHAVQFCMENNIENIYITLNKSDIYCEHGTINHPIMDDMFDFTHFLNIEYKFQDEDKYGPAAAILPHLDISNSSLSDDFIVLFGDNFYKGKLPHEREYADNDCIVSYLRKDPDHKNLRFAVIKQNIVIEKPHTEVEGKYFCGYCAFDYAKAVDLINKIKVSGRNEYEITEFINSFDNQGFIPNALDWGELTYQGDEEILEKLIQGGSND